MPQASLHDIRDYRFPADVQQCGECAALVLKSNASFHAGWHEAITAETNRKIADVMAERGRRPAPLGASRQGHHDG